MILKDHVASSWTPRLVSLLTQLNEQSDRREVKRQISVRQLEILHGTSKFRVLNASIHILESPSITTFIPVNDPANWTDNKSASTSA